ncbi:MAG: hypothetical protein ACRDWA_08850, partial [Acidimicrobiia bacterium]
RKPVPPRSESDKGVPKCLHSRKARRMKYDAVIRDLARTQNAVIARRQLREVGVDDRVILRRIQSGMLEPATSRVLKYNGVAPSPAQRLMIAVLHVGADTYISHTTAAAWWGIAGFQLDRVHVSIERVYHFDHEAKPIIVHHSTVIPEWCRKIHNGVPVVSPGLAIFQMAGTISPDRVARALDSAWSLGLINGVTIDRLLDRLGRSGRNGIVLMRKLRKQRPDDWTPPASNLESRFDEIMAPHGLRFRRQVDIGDEEWCGRVDFLAQDWPLVVEVLSERYHSSLTDRESDRTRRERHSAMGLVVVEVWEREIFYTPWVVVGRVLAARAALLPGSRDAAGPESGPAAS